jgi:RNA-binding protein YhbY
MACSFLSQPAAAAFLQASFLRSNPQTLFQTTSAAENNESSTTSSSSSCSISMERAWRYAKKPLLSIGSKGATFSHGNSLRQLLEAHTAVKVKVNTQKFNDSLEQAFDALKACAVESGAPATIELLQARDKQHILFIAMPGTRERIERGEFPPVISSDVDEDDETEEL